MKNNKGFTLIELMIAIAIIGILALVLIPKVGGMKSQAKLAGIDTNLRLAQSTIEGIITDYEANAGGVTSLEDSIVDRLDSGVVTGVNKDIKNPITGATGVVAYTATTPSNGDKAFTYDTGDSATAEISDANVELMNNTNLKGVIYYQAYYSGTDLMVNLYPFDDNGNYMKGKKKVIVK